MNRKERLDHKLHDRKAEEFILKKVKEIGWSIQVFDKTEEEPGFAYTIGLVDTFDHPEIICFGLAEDDLKNILNIAGENIKSGKKYKKEVMYEEFLEGFVSTFIDVDQNIISDYLGYGIWYYGSDSFELIQLVWPDMNCKFPWQKEFDENIKFLQPILNSTLKT
ncbi:MAG: DUF4262 domain-containing protein [Balneola sp.]